MVAQKWSGQGAARNRVSLGQRYFNGHEVVTEIPEGGLSSLLEINSAPGAARKMSDEALAALKQELETGIGFSSYTAIALVVRTGAWANC